MAKQYDLVVIGAGTAAMGAAMRIRNAGWSVGLVDFRPFGGTCALRGCDPKKMLIGGATAADHVRRMIGKGIADDVRIDWGELMAFKRSFTDPVPEKPIMVRRGSPAATRCGSRARAWRRNTS